VWHLDSCFPHMSPSPPELISPIKYGDVRRATTFVHALLFFWPIAPSIHLVGAVRSEWRQAKTQFTRMLSTSSTEINLNELCEFVTLLLENLGANSHRPNLKCSIRRQ
jgi:hypothetical protein